MKSLTRARLRSFTMRGTTVMSMAILMGASAKIALAADYYLLVPMPGATAAESPSIEAPSHSITHFSLSPVSLPVGSVDVPYRYDFKPALQVEGDGAFDAGKVQWRISDESGRPPGLELSQAGVLEGVPLEPTADDAFIEVTAQYNDKLTSRKYDVAVRHVDPYWAHVTALVGFDGVPGSTSYSEPVKPPAFLSLKEQAQLVADAKFGNASLSVVNGHAELPGSLFAFGGRPFTYELYVKLRLDASGTLLILETRPTSTNGPYITWSLTTSGASVFYVNSATRLPVAAGAIPNNGQWHHLAYSRDGNQVGRLFINGMLVGSWADTTDYQAAAVALIGKNAFNSAQVGGFVDAIRVTDGVARYTSNFTPPKLYPTQ